MINSQRMMIMIIAIQVMVGITSTVYLNENENELNYLAYSQYNNENIESGFTSDTGLYGSVKSSGNRAWESTAGNPIKWGILIISTFTNNNQPPGFDETLP